MNITRRGFLTGMAGILAAKVAPAFVGSSILMPVIATATPTIIVSDNVLIEMQGKSVIRAVRYDEATSRWVLADERTGDIITRNGVVYVRDGGEMREPTGKWMPGKWAR